MQLNRLTKKDSYALPRVEDLLDCIAGNKFFSIIDMKSGYYQVEILEDHKERTAFSVGPLGFYEYNRMPFGLTNSPATYQRLMENILADLNLKICCVFIDDVIIFGKTFEEHLNNIQLVFNKIQEATLKLAPSKCQFFKRKVKFIGHIVSEKAKLDATGHRWLAALASFNFDIKYRAGRNNADADALSRLPTINIETVQAICHSTVPAYVKTLTLSPSIVLDDEDPRGTSTGNIIDWCKAQDLDPGIKRMRDYVQSNVKPSRKEIGSNSLLRQFQNLRLIDGVLHLVTTDEGIKHQLVLPIAHASTVMEALHNDMGHPGKDRTISLIKERFYWPGMHSDVETWITECGRCTRRKTPTNQQAPLVNIVTSAPLELVCMDYLTLEASKGGYQHMLVITDHFTRYALAIPTRNQLATTTAEAFLNHFIVHYGIPARIHSDQGANFEKKVIKELYSIAGMSKSRTTSYHAMGNGMCERFNRTLLGSLPSTKKANWKAYVNPLVHAYNCTRHESTGQTPCLLMFGRIPRLPVDMTVGLRENEKEPTTQYVTDLRSKIQKAYELAADASEKARTKQRDTYNTKVRGGTVKVGDRVLVKIVAFDGKHKLADRWEQEPYTVIVQPNSDITIFTVRRENGEGRTRTLHRNLLLLMGFIHDAPTPDPRKSRVKPAAANVNEEPENNHQEESGESDSEDDSSWGVIVSQVEQEDSSPVIGDDSEIAHETNNVSFQNASASDTEIAQEEVPDAATSQTETEQTEEVPLMRSTRQRKLLVRYQTGDFMLNAR
ncbi:uncharacterized protein K02A2.6-like [Ostrea edulis]|uniref:uncharacterized protein K02A2.6-like n=1 Tax=Ostrea edulis TaxID=37623 RepID=UPI0024AFCC4A|nr:uncharacterized protein K02A2.6-like [Ostrea edulis]